MTHDTEVFWMSSDEIAEYDWRDGEGDLMGEGWYWWYCMPGYLPSSDPYGPFETEQEARDHCAEESEETP